MNNNGINLTKITLGLQKTDNIYQTIKILKPQTRTKNCYFYLDISNSNFSNYLLQTRKLHMVLFKLEMIQANSKLCYTEKNYTT